MDKKPYMIYKRASFCDFMRRWGLWTRMMNSVDSVFYPWEVNGYMDTKVDEFERISKIISKIIELLNGLTILLRNIICLAAVIYLFISQLP